MLDDAAPVHRHHELRLRRDPGAERSTGFPVRGGGYAGDRQDDLCKLLLRGFPSLKKSWAQQLAALFDDLRAKCSSGEISARALDLRGLLTACG